MELSAQAECEATGGASGAGLGIPTAVQVQLRASEAANRAEPLGATAEQKYRRPRGELWAHEIFR